MHIQSAYNQGECHANRRSAFHSSAGNTFHVVFLQEQKQDRDRDCHQNSACAEPGKVKLYDLLSIVIIQALIVVAPVCAFHTPCMPPTMALSNPIDNAVVHPEFAKISRPVKEGLILRKE